MLGEVIAWRNLFWALTDAMAMNPTPWVNGAVLPNLQSGSSYRVFAGDAYGRVKEIVEKIVASSLIYLPSSAKDFKNPAIDRYLARYVRGSHGIDYKQRIKVMKLLWDAIGTEFGGRHELYERNYAGNHEDIRIQALWSARTSGTLDQMTALAEQCMSEYDENGWTDPAWLNPDDVAYPGLPRSARGGVIHELDRPTARRCHGRRLHGSGAGAGRYRRAAGIPRSHEPARRRRARRHHRRAGRQERLYRDRGLLGDRPAGDASRLPQPPQQQRAAARRKTACFASTRSAPAEEKLADIFAGRSGVHLDERFSIGEWMTLKTGSPVLASAVVAFDCRTVEIKAVASHNVVFGAVEAVRLGPSGPALVYHDRAYKPV